MKMQESPEDYLEAILVLSRELGNVRSIDVANYGIQQAKRQCCYEATS